MMIQNKKHDRAIYAFTVLIPNDLYFSLQWFHVKFPKNFLTQWSTSSDNNSAGVTMCHSTVLLHNTIVFNVNYVLISHEELPNSLEVSISRHWILLRMPSYKFIKYKKKRNVLTYHKIFNIKSILLRYKK